ncbi:FAD-dependent oxidoreductase [Celerinatantimonas sp. YJH-8]|uniref:FAD-dependent oxidoreductase n=1 Tax=Celerinatantimonas sp. YJH-8 TaxID=3228714 RepID=UPI0038BFE84C
MSHSSFQVAIIGGGAAGSIAALRLAESGVSVHLFEQGPELVNGPPFCHLHAGGCLYRELSDQQCLTLLEQSIQTARSFPMAMRPRPTLIAVPKRDQGQVDEILPRLKLLRHRYQQLIEQDHANQVLGASEDYYRLFSREQLEQIAQRAVPVTASSAEDWLVNAAQQLDLDQLKYPVLLVQEYGMSLFRVAAMVTLAAERLPSLSVHLNSAVKRLRQQDDCWQITYQQQQQAHALKVDYVINAAGYRSGEIDDLVGASKQRLVEFKAAYLVHWPQAQGLWPEIVIHGQRGTKQGMAQLTPYGEGVFQLHGMAPGITLFEQGIAQSSPNSAQPRLPEQLAALAEGRWPQALIEQRTRAAIEHIAAFIPSFEGAVLTARPLSGAQQIPGSDLQQRVSGASFVGERYARSEIVKFSSALTAADDILRQLQQYTDVALPVAGSPLMYPAAVEMEHLNSTATDIVVHRHYPQALAAGYKNNQEGSTVHQ